MIEPGIYIGTFTMIFLLTGIYIWNRDTLYGGIYFFLFMYVIFAQIGYAYFPEISASIKAYFGPEIFYDFSLFVTLSFVCLFLCFVLLHRYVVRKPAYRVGQTRHRLNILFYFVIIGHLLLMGLYFSSHYDSLTYGNVSDETFQAQEGIAFSLFIVGFKLTVGISFMLYFLVSARRKGTPSLNRHAVFLLLLLELFLMGAVSLKIGNRTDPLALAVAIVVLEVELVRVVSRSAWWWIKVALFVGAVFYGLNVIEGLRSEGLSGSQSAAERILLKDYYPPAHILIAAMALDYVDPWEVVTSNSANALVLLKYPYLQATVTDLFNPGISTRSSSYAFYLFSEGYLVLGWFGFLYNGVIVFLGVAIWRRLANSNDRYYNLFMTGLIATQVVNIARGQSSYFLKDIYMFFIPAMLLFFLATGFRPRLGLGWKLKLPMLKPVPSLAQR